MPGTLTHRENEIVQKLFVALSLGTLPTDSDDWPIYAGQEPNTPDNVITLISTTPILQGRLQTSGQVQDRKSIQIRVRAARESTAHTKMRAIVDAVEETIYQNQVNVGSSIYVVHSMSRVSGPISLGKDVNESKRSAFSLNVTMSIRQTT